jgi:very-short-patch-repair endonuclease
MKIYYKPKLKQYSRNLRNDSTLSEVLLWMQIKGRKIKGYQFMRQKPIENYIVDFYCSKLKLAIEIDGSSHIGKELADKIRQEKLESLGIRFLRFDDLEVKRDIQSVIRKLETWIEEKNKIEKI